MPTTKINAYAFSALKQADLSYQNYRMLYKALIQNADNVDKLPIVFEALNRMGLSIQRDPAFYKTVIENAYLADRLPAIFEILEKNGIDVLNHLTLYKVIINNSHAADKLPVVFERLQKLGITIEGYPRLYELIIDKIYYQNKWPLVFTKLVKAGISVQNAPDVYEAVIQNVYSADKLPAVFDGLEQLGLALQHHLAFYKSVIQNAAFAPQLLLAFVALQKVGLSPQTHLGFYEAVIQKASSAEKLPTAFETLQNSGLDVHHHFRFYEAIIKNVVFTDVLPAAFAICKHAGITIENHLSLYETLIQNIYKTQFIDNLSAAFKTLEKNGLTPQNHLMLYESVIQNIDFTYRLPAAFVVCKNAGMTIENHLTIYEVVTKNIYKIHSLDELCTAFNALKYLDMLIPNHYRLYEAMIGNLDFADRLPELFATLTDAGITVENHLGLYEAAIQKLYVADDLPLIFAILANAGITTQHHLMLYEAVIQHIDFIEKLPLVFETLDRIGITLEDHLSLYTFVFQQLNTDIQFLLDKISQLGLNVPGDVEMIDSALKGGAMGLDVLTWIQENTFQKDQHLYIYKACFLGSCPLVRSPYYLNKIKIQFKEYFKINALLTSVDDAYDAQCLALQQLIDKVVSIHDQLTEGPLNKSAASLEVEIILKRIAVAEKIEKIRMAYTDDLGYLLQFDDEPEVYLSALLKLANFNHIELSDEEVNLLGEKIEFISHDFNQQSISTTLTVLERLPDAARRALSLYVGNKLYTNMNRLFRGVAPISESQYVWITPIDSSHSFIANFLVGSLVNWSAAELSKRLLSSTLPSYGLVDRGEILNTVETANGELDIEKRRIANPVFMPSVTSFSVFESGAPFFRKPGTVRTKIETDNSSRPIMNSYEGEILVVQGTSYFYTQNPSGGFFAREINSPGITPNGDYWSSIALAEAYRNYLSKPYLPSTDRIKIEDVSIERPNHALAHEYRVMIYIDLVIDYFAHHAKDPAFSAFCQSISLNERAWIRVAAAYSITGRNSELSFVEDAVGYDNAREASKTHMKLFLDKYPPREDDPGMRERMLDVVRWMGNPGYEQTYCDKPAKNQHTSSEEREHRNYIYRILSFAHKLDLPRCYTPEQFNIAMEITQEYVTSNHDQKADYIRMIQYAIDLINAHGDQLCMDLTPAGDFIPCSKAYRSPFQKVSVNLRQLREVTETVPYPKLIEQYQFSLDNKP